MQPLYYLPDMTVAGLFPGGSPSPAVLAERGLTRIAWDVRDRRECSLPTVERGPDGGRGLIVSFDCGRARPEPLGYYPEQQTWRQIGPATWLGYRTDQPPGPRDLARTTQILGHDVALRHQVWHVPILRFPVPAAGEQLQWTTQLPRVMAWDVASRFQPRVREEWEWLWQRSEEMWDVLMAAEPDEHGQASFDLEQVCDLAIDCLSANYRVDRAVQSALGILDSQNWEDVLRAAINWPAMVALMQAQKKTDPAAAPREAPGANSPPGPADDTPAMPPVEPSST